MYSLRFIFFPYQQKHQCGRVFLWIRNFSSHLLSPTGFVFWFVFFLVNVWFIIFIYSFFNGGWIQNTISTSICLKIFYYLLHNFISLTNCWNFEIVMINSSVVNNEFYLFFCICATHFSSKILQNCSISVIHSYNYLKVQSSKLQESLLFDLPEIFWKSNNF